MKKSMIVLAAIIFAACGGNSSTEQTVTDSTSVADSISVVDSSLTAVDTNTAKIRGGKDTVEVPVEIVK